MAQTFLILVKTGIFYEFSKWRKIEIKKPIADRPSHKMPGNFSATFIILGNFFNFEQLLVKKRVFLIFCCEKLCIWQINHRKYVLLKISLQVSLKNILFDPIFHDKTMK